MCPLTLPTRSKREGIRREKREGYMGAGGFEPPDACLRGRCLDRLAMPPRWWEHRDSNPDQLFKRQPPSPLGYAPWMAFQRFLFAFHAISPIYA